MTSPAAVSPAAVSSVPAFVAGARGLLDHSAVPAFVTSGRAVFTVHNPATGGRFTFKVTAPKRDRATGDKVAPEQAGVRFVAVLTGPDNGSDYTYTGNLWVDGERPRYTHGRKSAIGPDAPSARAAAWFFARVATGTIPATLEVWHEGACCRCGRTLTVPESVSSGIGPECRRKRGA